MDNAHFKNRTFGFAEVQGVLGARDAQRLPGVDVSSRVVVAFLLLLLSSLLCRTALSEEEEEAAKRVQQPPDGARVAPHGARVAPLFHGLQ